MDRGKLDRGSVNEGVGRIGVNGDQAVVVMVASGVPVVPITGQVGVGQGCTQAELMYMGCKGPPRGGGLVVVVMCECSVTSGSGATHLRSQLADAVVAMTVQASDRVHCECSLE